LGGLGIRDIAWFKETYIIIAGSSGGGGPFRLYRWAGGTARPEHIKVARLNDYHPEAIIIYPQKGLSEIQILSDDGKSMVGDENQHQLPWPQRHFRSFWVVHYP